MNNVKLIFKNIYMTYHITLCEVSFKENIFDYPEIVLYRNSNLAKPNEAIS